MRRRAAAALTLLVVAAAPGLADAQSRRVKAQARQHYDKAREHYNLAEYDQAIVEFKEAYRLWKQPLFLFNIGQSYRLKGDCPEAMRFYKSYLREEPKPSNRDELDKAMALCASAQTTPAQPDAEPEEVEPRPLETPTPEPDPAPAQRSDVTTPSFVQQHRLSLVAGTAAVVLGGVATGLSLSAWSDYQDLAERCVGVPCPEEDVDAVDRKALYTNIAWGAAGAAVLTSAILYLFVEKDAESSARATLVPAARGASVQVRF